MTSAEKRRRNARILDNNHAAIASVTAPASPGFPFSNAVDEKRGRVWKPGTNSFSFTLDLLSAKQFTFIAIFGQSNATFKISNAAVITLEANSINYFTSGVPYTKVIPVTDAGAFADLTDSTDPEGQQYRFVKITIDDSTNPDDLEIAYLYLGDHTSFAFNANQGFQFQPVDLSRRVSSDSGVMYSVRKNQYSNFTGMGFSFIPEDDRTALLQTVARIGITGAFVFVLDPLETSFSHDFGVKLCKFEALPQLTHVYMNKFNISFSIREVI